MNLSTAISKVEKQRRGELPEVEPSEWVIQCNLAMIKADRILDKAERRREIERGAA